tara:strand:+ start:939 stop:1154 length:216 start_codon:yes stop_codon:yes gene_type:complete
MKKSDKPEVNPEELLKEFNKIISLINNISNQDLTQLNLDELSDKAKKIQKETENKYNPIIKKLKNNLDSTK